MIRAYDVTENGTKIGNMRALITAEEKGTPDGMRVDRSGRLYVATRMGIQVCDQAGRVQCILPTPNGRVANLTFVGHMSQSTVSAGSSLRDLSSCRDYKCLDDVVALD